MLFGFKTSTHNIRPISKNLLLQAISPKINFDKKYSNIQYSRIKNLYLETSFSKYTINADEMNLKARMALLEFFDNKLKEILLDDTKRKYQLNKIIDSLFSPTRDSDFISKKREFEESSLPGLRQLLFYSMSQVTLRTKGEQKDSVHIQIMYSEFVKLIEYCPEILFTLNFYASEQISKFSIDKREESGFKLKLDNYIGKILSKSGKTPSQHIKLIFDKFLESFEIVKNAEVYEGTKKTAVKNYPQCFKFKLYKRQTKGINNDKTIEIDTEKEENKIILSKTIEFDAGRPEQVRRAIFSAMVYMLNHPDTFIVGSYTEGTYKGAPRVDFLYADVYGLYDRSYVDASEYSIDFPGKFFYKKFSNQIGTNGYYPQSIIGDWEGMEGRFAEHEPLFKFFEEGEFIPLSKFHDHEDPNNADVIRANAKLPADEYVLFRLARYFLVELYDGGNNPKYDFAERDSDGNIIGFEYHDFTTEDQWTEWSGPIDRLEG